MKNKGCNLYAIVVLTIIGSIFLFYADVSDASQCFIVKIDKEIIDGKDRIYLYPSELKIPKDTCVIWVSWIVGENVNINFHESSKSCMIASKAKSGFIEAEGCFLSDFLEPGQTVSLYFKETGTFGYRLEILEKAEESGKGAHRKSLREGKIIVE